MNNWFSGTIPVIREDMTIAQQILAHTAAMRKDGTLETTSLCWSPAELELLAMFAIDAKYQLARIAARKRKPRSVSRRPFPRADR